MDDSVGRWLASPHGCLAHEPSELVPYIFPPRFERNCRHFPPHLTVNSGLKPQESNNSSPSLGLTVKQPSVMFSGFSFRIFSSRSLTRTKPQDQTPSSLALSTSLRSPDTNTRSETASPVKTSFPSPAVPVLEQELELLGGIREAYHSPEVLNIRSDMVIQIDRINAQLIGLKPAKKERAVVRGTTPATQPTPVHGRKELCASSILRTPKSQSRVPLRVVNGNGNMSTNVDRKSNDPRGRDIHNASMSMEPPVATSYNDSTGSKSGGNDCDTTLVDDCTGLLDNYTALKRLGHGTFGVVYLLQHKTTSKLLAAKVVPKVAYYGESFDRSLVAFVREQGVAKSIPRHPFVLSMEASFHDNYNYYMLTPFYPGGDLDQALRKCGRLSHERTRFYVAQLLLAVEHLHKHKIIHRDIKPANVLLDARGNAVLADLGLCLAFEDKGKGSEDRRCSSTASLGYGFDGVPFDFEEPSYTTSEYCGTEPYMAPEILMRQEYSFDVDIWSLGITAFEMRCGRRPWGGKNESQCDLRSLREGIVCEPLQIKQEDKIGLRMEQILHRMLVKNPLFRGTVEELKGHRYFRGMNWKKLSAGKVKASYIPGEYSPDVEAAEKGQPFWIYNQYNHVYLPTGKPYSPSEDPHPELHYRSPRLDEPIPQETTSGLRKSVSQFFGLKGKKQQRYAAMKREAEARAQAHLLWPRGPDVMQNMSQWSTK